MKKLFTIVAFASLMALPLQSCHTSKKVIVNYELDTSTDGPMLLGPQTRDQFNKEPYTEWFQYEYDAYQPDPEIMHQLKKERLTSYKIKVFLGTWCSDSQRDFPRLMKILDELKYPEDKLTIIGVNRKKESPRGEDGPYNIQRVPTTILERYGKQIGRIIEYPESGVLEKDLLNIIVNYTEPTIESGN